MEVFPRCSTGVQSVVALPELDSQRQKASGLLQGGEQSEN